MVGQDIANVQVGVRFSMAAQSAMSFIFILIYKDFVEKCG